MKLDILTDGELELYSDVEYFEVRANDRVYIERYGESVTVDGTIAGGEDYE